MQPTAHAWTCLKVSFGARRKVVPCRTSISRRSLKLVLPSAGDSLLQVILPRLVQLPICPSWWESSAERRSQISLQRKCLPWIEKGRTPELHDANAIMSEAKERVLLPYQLSEYVHKQLAQIELDNLGMRQGMCQKCARHLLTPDHSCKVLWVDRDWSMKLG